MCVLETHDNPPNGIMDDPNSSSQEKKKWDGFWVFSVVMGISFHFLYAILALLEGWPLERV